jgi:radical SAM superfamily enzyme YgiQ (UPF0313 family)
MAHRREFRVMLINSPNKADKAKQNANYALFPHIGIVQLATRIKQDFKNQVLVHICDGGISFTEQICQEIREFEPDLVGISVLTPTYSEGLRIAQAAKEMGALVVLGDEHAIFFPEQILANRPYVDYIVANDVGEQPFAELISALLLNRPLESVSSLYHRTAFGIQKNPSRRYELKTQNTQPDLALIQDTLPLYAQNYNRAHGHLHDRFMNVVTINNARGCENGRVRCSYCSIADLSLNTGEPSQFWNLIWHYHVEHGINLFFEVYDSFTASPVYVDALLQTMPPQIADKIDTGDIELMVYARALGLLKKDTVAKLQKLGVRRVNIGLDSGDTKMLEAQRKNKTTNETNLAALKMLVDAGMTVHGSYILGAPGETVESVEHTVQHIEQTLSEIRYSSVEVSRLFPLANSPIWDMMVNFDKPQFYKDTKAVDDALKALNIIVPEKIRRYLKESYRGHDLLDTDALIADWYTHFTHVTEAHVLDRINHIDALLECHHVQTGKNIG